MFIPDNINNLFSLLFFRLRLEKSAFFSALLNIGSMRDMESRGRTEVFRYLSERIF